MNTGGGRIVKKKDSKDGYLTLSSEIKRRGWVVLMLIWLRAVMDNAGARIVTITGRGAAAVF